MSNIIGLYYIGLEDEPNNGYYEKDIEGVIAAIQELPVEESGFIIKRFRWRNQSLIICLNLWDFNDPKATTRD